MHEALNRNLRSAMSGVTPKVPATGPMVVQFARPAHAVRFNHCNCKVRRMLSLSRVHGCGARHGLSGALASAVLFSGQSASVSYHMCLKIVQRLLVEAVFRLLLFFRFLPRPRR